MQGNDCKSTLKIGAVALLDPLEFKGVRKEDPQGRDSVREKMCSFRKAVEESLNGLEKHYESYETYPACGVRPNFKLLFLSDTIIFAAWYENREASDPVSSITAVCGVLPSILCRAVQQPPELAYRGCVAVGEFAVLENFLTGPAIDEATEHHQLADGAFVYLAPSALGAVCHVDARNLEIVTLKFRVPLTNGCQFETRVINPFSSLVDHAKHEAFRESLIQTFNDSNPTVAVMNQNTQSMLQRAMRVTGEH